MDEQYLRDGFICFLTESDPEKLKHYASLTEGEGACIEIGSLQGASTADILSTLPDKYDLICSSMHEPENYMPFRRNCLNHNIWNRVIPVTGDFRNLFNHLNITEFRFVFCDHDHSEDGMRDFFKLILPKCGHGCWLLFHDYLHENCPAVKKWVDTLDPNLYKKYEHTPSMAVFRVI